MSSPVRRSLVLSAGLTLVLACTGVFAPAALAKKPPTHHIPAPRVAGINVDASTIPQLQALMNRHRLKSVQLTQFYLHRIKKLNPLLNAVITVSPTALADAARRRQGAQARLASPAARDPGHREGQRRHDRHADHGRLVGPGGQPPERRVHRPAAARRRRHRDRQGQPVGVGELPVRPLVERLDRHRRPDQHGVRARPQPVRLELRHGRRRVRRPRDGRRGHRDRRLDRLPFGRQRHRRHQADAGPAGAGPASCRSRPTRTRPAR